MTHHFTITKQFTSGTTEEKDTYAHYMSRLQKLGYQPADMQKQNRRLKNFLSCSLCENLFSGNNILGVRIFYTLLQAIGRK